MAPSPVVALDHLAIGVPRAAEATRFLVGDLGGQAYAAGPGAGFRWWQYRYAGGGLLELLEPEGPPGGFLHRFLERRGPGVHHATFKVKDIHDAMGRARELGYEVVNFNEDFPGWKEAFLHPKQAQGIVVQLAESATSEDEIYDAERWPFLPAPDPGPAATLIGARLAARDAARARRQWETLLGGSCQENGRELVFRWPASPLRLAVEIEPGAEEGPRAVELSTPNGVALPEGPHPVLGATFVAG